MFISKGYSCGRGYMQYFAEYLKLECNPIQHNMVGLSLNSF